MSLLNSAIYSNQFPSRLTPRLRQLVLTTLFLNEENILSKATLRNKKTPYQQDPRPAFHVLDLPTTKRDIPATTCRRIKRDRHQTTLRRTRALPLFSYIPQLPPIRSRYAKIRILEILTKVARSPDTIYREKQFVRRYYSIPRCRSRFPTSKKSPVKSTATLSPLSIQPNHGHPETGRYWMYIG